MPLDTAGELRRVRLSLEAVGRRAVVRGRAAVVSPFGIVARALGADCVLWTHDFVRAMTAHSH